jgi:hypothetical protein
VGARGARKSSGITKEMYSHAPLEIQEVVLCGDASLFSVYIAFIALDVCLVAALFTRR